MDPPTLGTDLNPRQNSTYNEAASPLRTHLSLRNQADRRLNRRYVHLAPFDTSKSVLARFATATMSGDSTEASDKLLHRDSGQHPAVGLSSRLQSGTADCSHQSACGPIVLRLQVNQSMDCVCRLTKDVFLHNITSFLNKYGSAATLDSQGLVVHYGKSVSKGGRCRQQGYHAYEYWNIVHPEDIESRVHDRMILSDTYKHLVERGCNAEGREIRLTVLKRF